MFRSRIIAPLMFLLVFGLSACQPIRAETARPATAQHTTPLATDAQSMVIDGTDHSTVTNPEQAKAEAEFLAAAMAKEEAYYAEDYASLRSFYADNIVSILPDTPEVVGIVAWSEGMKPFLDGHDTVGKLTIKHIWVSGDYASRQAEWEEVVTPNDGGKPFHQIGRCVLNWQKIDGKWKIVSELINYLVPPTEME